MTTLRSERGAALIIVAVALLGLTLFSAIVLDFGILWTSRGQAQNAADAAAMAGALVLEGDPTDGPGARNAARAFARENRIWSEALADADIEVSWPLPSPCPVPDTGVNACITVDVFRGAGTHTNTLPTFFAQLAGVNEQGVRATATAEVKAGNATNCLKPWIISDGWEEHSVPTNLQFDLGIDVYRKPDPGPGTGYKASMIGQTVILANGDPNDAIAPSNYYEADLNGSGASNFLDNIEHCVGITKQINALDPPSCPAGADDIGCVNLSNGRKPNANVSGAEFLIALDPYATIDASGVVHGSCAPTCASAPGRLTSPRIVPVALFDPAVYTSGDRMSGNLNLPIVNIMAFFVQSVVSSGPNKGQITGVLAGDAAIFHGTGSAGIDSSFLRISGLVR